MADIGYFVRLDKSLASDKFALAAETLESVSIFLEVLVAVGESSTNPGAKAPRKVRARGRTSLSGRVCFLLRSDWCTHW